MNVVGRVETRLRRIAHALHREDEIREAIAMGWEAHDCCGDLIEAYNIQESNFDCAMGAIESLVRMIPHPLILRNIQPQKVEAWLDENDFDFNLVHLPDKEFVVSFTSDGELALAKIKFAEFITSL